MNSSLLLSITTFAYLVCAIFYLSGVIFRHRPLLIAGGFAGLGTLLIQTAGILLRWKESYDLGYGHAPLSNLYESLVFAAWAIMLIYLIFEYKTKQHAMGVFPSIFSFLAMAYASFSTQIDSKIQPLVPALKSNWLIAHVVACFLGYAAFAVAAGVSVLYLARKASPANPHPKGMLALIPESRQLDEFNYQLILFGFLWLSLGIITGSVWANSAWGSYWSWDPKETWSLITWLIYAALLHSRSVQGWRGRKVAWLSLVGFVCVLFTYFGVNFLLSGLHSYATQ
ncbi:c-type cytochrome biogenesis protein CcsB [Desulfoferrobacter suflitae]|uniref:c-type cytochrome biogenesis protein CcsB n=1 Tax=Desulfoferrobacter suflitae TaxID=2865782 RepID=UPI002164C747|nr:c-type cytochrome biogenesis protein CcsB [Desulfoferrobacter suflitae]MCK8604315.1 c-type cytochrome biogenesis protein CcsB [Desulfoferrobacter suflitae]